MDPNFGDRVVVCPAPGLRVQADGIHGRFLAALGEEVIWSEWYHRRLRDGSISLVVAPSNAPKKDGK